MPFSKVEIYRTHDSAELFIVEVEPGARGEDGPIHVSDPLAADEARNFLRHFNFSETEIHRRLRNAPVNRRAAAATA
ncbi:MAG: hypothetical protein JO061_06965 [Acidobacteriaceae bacterium]|nr:hypothetical protein [Acidobacteriaceae bacterium]